MTKYLKRLFFFPKRQLLREKKSYISIFAVIVSLLLLTMTFMIIVESYFVMNSKTKNVGTYHVKIRGLANNYSESFAKERYIKDVFYIPYTAVMIRGNIESPIARVTCSDSDTENFFDISYIFGNAPENTDEIAVSKELYESFYDMKAGEEYDFLFRTHEESLSVPLKICGVFESNDSLAGYVLVSDRTYEDITSKTASKIRYDFYLNFKKTSDRYIAKYLDILFEKYHLVSTEWQSRKNTDNLDLHDTRTIKYAEYINSEYVDSQKKQNAFPSLLCSLPIIIIASLMSASFMITKTYDNTAFLGVMSSFGATPFALSLISAGEILFLTFFAAIPVSVFSSLISYLFIRAYSFSSASASFSIPIYKIVKAALIFCFLSFIFTYIGTRKLTSKEPFKLISGCAQAKTSFVKRSSEKTEKAKSKIRYLSFLISLREIRGEVFYSIITSVVCIICGGFLFSATVVDQISLRSPDSLPYASEITVSVSDDQVKSESVSYITSEIYESLSDFPGIILRGMYSNSERLYVNCNVENDETSNFLKAAAVTRDLPSLFAGYTVSGEPDALFDSYDRVILYVPENRLASCQYSAGDILSLSSYSNSADYSGETLDFEICAIVSGKSDYADISSSSGRLLIFSADGLQALGLWKKEEFENALVDFDFSLSDEEKRELTDKISASPDILHFQVENHRIKAESEKGQMQMWTFLKTLFFTLLYFSLCLTTYVRAKLRIKNERKNVAVFRQIGADKKAIHKTTSTRVFLPQALSFAITVTLAFAIYLITVSALSRNLNVNADYYHLSGAVYSSMKEEIRQIGSMILMLLAFSVPMHIVSLSIELISTRISTRNLLKENITEALRKETD